MINNSLSLLSQVLLSLVNLVVVVYLLSMLVFSLRSLSCLDVLYLPFEVPQTIIRWQGGLLD